MAEVAECIRNVNCSFEDFQREYLQYLSKEKTYDDKLSDLIVFIFESAKAEEDDLSLNTTNKRNYMYETLSDEELWEIFMIGLEGKDIYLKNVVLYTLLYMQEKNFDFYTYCKIEERRMNLETIEIFKNDITDMLVVLNQLPDNLVTDNNEIKYNTNMQFGRYLDSKPSFFRRFFNW